MSKKSLLVPIMLEGLVLGRDNAPNADMTPNFEQLKFIPFGKSAANSFFTEKQELSGIHLHWSMPDALLEGFIDESNNLKFPNLPNRWIVTRLLASGGSLCRKAWLIESDYVTNETAKTCNGIYKTTMPTFKYVNGSWTGAGLRNEIYGYVGDVREFGASRSENGYYLNELTAVGAGDALFAAFYPKCRTVFGFYDNMSEAANGIYTYVVTGWYSDEKKDPLYNAAKGTLDKLMWSYDGGGEAPQSVICHGALKDILWDGIGKAYDTSVPKDDVDVYIGNTSAEALAALLQAKNTDVQGLERILNALLNNFLVDLDNPDNPDSLIEFEECVHAKQFAQAEDGESWVLRKCSGSPSLEPSSDDYKDLYALCDMQAETNELEHNLNSLKEELYFAWWKYVLIRKDPFASTDKNMPGQLLKAYRFNEIPNAANSSAKEFMDVMTSLLAQIKACSEKIKTNNEKVRELASSLNLSLKKKNLIVETVKGNRFYTSNPPVIMMAGDGVKRGYKQGFQTNDDGLLPCRLNAVASLLVKLPGKAVEVTPSDILSVCNPLMKQMAAEMESIVGEAALLSQRFAKLIAAIAFDKLKMPYNEKQLAEAAKDIQKNQAELTAFSGSLPYRIANALWSQPWTPLVMEWDVRIMPSREQISKDDSFKAFILGDIDLEPKNNIPIRMEKELEIQGRTLISPHAVTNMHNMLNMLIEDYGKEGKHYIKLKEAVKAIEKANILSQQMDGFNEALTMRDNFPFVPIYNPFTDTEQIAKEISVFLNNYLLSPRILKARDNFLPVRAGLMHLTQIRIVDSFGQIKKVDLNKKKAKAAESISYADEAYEALLRPRILQPCITDFKWLSCGPGGKAALEKYTSPVFAYLIPNFLDKSLQVYDSDGVLLGFVQQGAHGVKWFPAPGASTGAEDISSKHLRYFVRKLLRDGSSLKELLDCMDMSFNSIETSSPESFLQLCFGNIVVLARASVDVRKKGMPHYLQSWDVKRDMHEYTTEVFDIKLGDYRKVRDGLVGFFKGGEEEKTYERFFACTKNRSGSYVEYNNIISATLAKPSQDLTVMLDPLGCITVRTGFLPERSIELPPEFFEIDKMQMMLRLAPVLSEQGIFSAPVPGGMEWSFQYIDSKNALITKEVNEPIELLPSERLQALEGFMLTDAKEEER